MRILFCNKYNYAFSGTEAYMFEAMELLRSCGHEAALFSMRDPRGRETPYNRHFVPHIDFKEPHTWSHKLAVAPRAIYSWRARRRLREMVLEFRPDVAHVRNIYHHLTPSILWELKAQKVPIIYHLNDFKLLCPSYNLVCRGKACEACKGGKFWHAVTAECYPGVGARLALACEAYIHKWLGSYRKCVECFIAPSEFVRDKFVEHGWDPNKFVVLPHFQRVERFECRAEKGGPILYFGRLSREKGIDDLLRAMQQVPEMKAVIAGDGPERGALENLCRELGLSNVSFVGALGKTDLCRAIAEAQFSVLPTHAYETFGKTILESYACGKPVIATDLGSRRELVKDGVTGLLYQTGNVGELTGAIQYLSSRPKLAESMGLAGRAFVEQKYTPESHYQKLMLLYESVRAGTFAGGSTVVSAVPERSTVKDDLCSPAAKFVPTHCLNPEPFWRGSGNSQAVFQKPRVRIAFIGGRGLISKYSGIETYYEEAGSRICAMGNEVTAYCRSSFTPALQTYRGMQIVRLPTVRSKHLETLVHTLLCTAHAVRSGYDIVHYHALGPALFSFIPRWFGKKTVVTVQGLDWQRKKWGRLASNVLRLGEYAGAVFPDKTIVVSRTLQEYYAKRYGRRPSYIPNGGLLRAWREPHEILNWGLDPGRYILFLGRLSPEKNCHLLIEAYEQLNTDVKLVLAGASSYSSDYSRKILEHASEQIRIYDWISGTTLDELITNAMIFVLPSDMEGLSLALLDAMGAGLCVLASDIPENREAIQNAGYTFKRGDAADLGDRLRFLIGNPAVREAVGNAARRRVEAEYLWSAVAESTERVYLDAMGWSVSDAPQRKRNGSVRPQQAEKMAG